MIETFYRPDPVGHLATTVPAPLINDCRFLLRHHENSCVFVPIRSMQFQAVIECREIVFVDALGEYRNQGRFKGRLIVVSWSFNPVDRESLTAPVRINLRGYRKDWCDLHSRIVPELATAVAQLRSRLKNSRLEPGSVVPIDAAS